MEERTIKVSINTAKEWYNSNNKTLKEIALQAFSEDELKVETFEDIKKQLGITKIKSNFFFTKLTDSIFSTDSEQKIVIKLNVIHKLSLIAFYYNNIHKNNNNEVYFIGKYKNTYKYGIDNTNFFIGLHDSVRYPGIIYFNKKEDATKAFNLIKDDLINNF